MCRLPRLQVPQVVIDFCCVLLLMTEVVLSSSTNDGYVYGRPAYHGDSMQQIGWKSQQYTTAPETIGWIPKFQSIPNKQSMQMDYGYSSPNSLYDFMNGRYPQYPTYPDGSVFGFGYGSPWQNSFKRRMQQPLSPYRYGAGFYGGYFYPNFGYGYGQPPPISWKGYGNRREDSMMNGNQWSGTSTTTTTTPRPNRPRKSKLFVANVWG